MRVRLPDADWHKNVNHVRKGATRAQDFASEGKTTADGFLEVGKLNAAEVNIGDMLLSYGVTDPAGNKVVILTIAIDGPVLYEVGRVHADAHWAAALSEPVAALVKLPKPSRALWAITRVFGDVRRRPQLVDDEGRPMALSQRLQDLMAGAMAKSTAKVDEHGLTRQLTPEQLRRRAHEADRAFVTASLGLWLTQMADVCNISFPVLRRIAGEVLDEAANQVADKVQTPTQTPQLASRRRVDLMIGE